MNYEPIFRSFARAATHTNHAITPVVHLHLALELSEAQWKLAFTIGHGQAPRLRNIRARDLAAVAAKAKQRFALPADAPVVSCYEAGREGFWLHRALLTQGIGNLIVDSSSIEVNRRQRRAKTDRIDAGKLVEGGAGEARQAVGGGVGGKVVAIPPRSRVGLSGGCRWRGVALAGAACSGTAG